MAREPEGEPTAAAELVDLAQLAVPRSEPRPKFSWERDDEAEKKPVSRSGTGRRKKSKVDPSPDSILEPQVVDLNIGTEAGVTIAAATAGPEQFLKSSYKWVKENLFGNVSAGIYASLSPVWFTIGISNLYSGRPFLGLFDGFLAGLYLVNAFLRSQPD